MGLGIGIGDRDWGLIVGIWIKIGDWELDRGLGSGIDIWIGDGDWGLGIGEWRLGLGIGIGD